MLIISVKVVSCGDRTSDDVYNFRFERPIDKKIYGRELLATCNSLNSGCHENC